MANANKSNRFRNFTNVRIVKADSEVIAKFAGRSTPKNTTKQKKERLQKNVINKARRARPLKDATLKAKRVKLFVRKPGFVIAKQRKVKKHFENVINDFVFGIPNKLKLFVLLMMPLELANCLGLIFFNAISALHRQNNIITIKAIHRNTGWMSFLYV